MNFLKEVQRRNNEKLGWDLPLDMGKKLICLRQEERRRVIVTKQKFRRRLHLVG